MRNGTAGQDEEYALSEVIGFILLLGVFVAAMSLWMIYIVPVNGREAEISHMNEVKDQFTSYKISLDPLWINSPYRADCNNNPSPDCGPRGVTLSTSMDLGTGGGDTQVSGLFLPMMNPIASSATLSVRDGDYMTITTDAGPKTYNMSALEYQSQNNYWIQQKYYYQCGGVFLSQQNGITYRISPPISFKWNPYSVIITPINLISTTGSMGGNGPVRVDTTIMNIQPPDTGNRSWVNVSVNVADYQTAMMWLGMFNNFRKSGGIPNSTSYFTSGNSSPTAPLGVAFINITSYPLSPPSVNLIVRPVNYTVTINNIVSNLN